MDTTIASFEQLITAAKDKKELNELAEKIGLQIDNRMLIENAKSGLLESFKNMSDKAQQITTESAKKITTDDDPLVQMRFGILDILNPDEAPMFEFVNDCGHGVKEGQLVPLWSFVHGQIYTVPYSIYEFLSKLTIPRSKWVQDETGRQRSAAYEQRRFNCEIIMDKEQIRKLQPQIA